MRVLSSKVASTGLLVTIELMRMNSRRAASHVAEQHSGLARRAALRRLYLVYKPARRFMGSYKWGYKSPNMGYKYSYPTYNPTYKYP